jgi:hypothetical protein
MMQKNSLGVLKATLHCKKKQRRDSIWTERSGCPGFFTPARFGSAPPLSTVEFDRIFFLQCIMMEV